MYLVCVSVFQCFMGYRNRPTDHIFYWPHWWCDESVFSSRHALLCLRGLWCFSQGERFLQTAHSDYCEKVGWLCQIYCLVSLVSSFMGISRPWFQYFARFWIGYLPVLIQDPTCSLLHLWRFEPGSKCILFQADKCFLFGIQCVCLDITALVDWAWNTALLAYSGSQLNTVWFKVPVRGLYLKLDVLY